MSATIVVKPRAYVYELLLTAHTAISHHDPAVQDDSNRMLFNRQLQLLPYDGTTTLPGQEQIDALATDNPVPGDIVDLVRGLTLPEFLAVALVETFISMYNSLDGTGLFSGMERYARLEARIRQAAIYAPSLRAWWNRLCRTMMVGIHGSADDVHLLRLLQTPTGLQQLTLRALTQDYRSIVAIARLWADTVKLQSPEYAMSVGKPIAAESVVLSWPVESAESPGLTARVVDVPAVSGNSLRHQVVREPAYHYLVAALGLHEAQPGQGPLPAGVEAIFYNGGNIEAGAKQPSNPHGLAQAIRRLYPSLDLLGGVTDSFDIGEGRLKGAGWLVCRENRQALYGSPAYDLPAARVSAFDMLDDETRTRQAGLTGEGQMIYSFETLCAGAQIVYRMVMPLDTPSLTRGALVTACEQFLSTMPVMGGQGARGYGWAGGEWLRRPDETDDALCGQAYADYLAENAAELVDGLTSGKLGTSIRVLT